MKRLINSSDFLELQLGERLVRVYKGEVQYYSYVAPHPIKGHYQKYTFVAVHGNSAMSVSVFRVSVKDGDVWFKMEDGPDRGVLKECILQQLEMMTNNVISIYRGRNKKG